MNEAKSEKQTHTRPTHTIYTNHRYCSSSSSSQRSVNIFTTQAHVYSQHITKRRRKKYFVKHAITTTTVNITHISYLRSRNVILCCIIPFCVLFVLHLFIFAANESVSRTQLSLCRPSQLTRFVSRSHTCAQTDTWHTLARNIAQRTPRKVYKVG